MVLCCRVMFFLEEFCPKSKCHHLLAPMVLIDHKLAPDTTKRPQIPRISLLVIGTNSVIRTILATHTGTGAISDRWDPMFQCRTAAGIILMLLLFNLLVSRNLWLFRSVARHMSSAIEHHTSCITFINLLHYICQDTVQRSPIEILTSLVFPPTHAHCPGQILLQVHVPHDILTFRWQDRLLRAQRFGV